MDLWSIVKTVGTGLISTMVPGGPLIVGAINAALPADKQLPENATGQQAQDAISALPPAERAQVMDKQFDVDITQIKESNETLRTMLTADATNPHSTRPYIAKHAFHIIAFTIVVMVSLWAYGIYKADTAMVRTIMDGWPFLLAAIAPFTALLSAYFGVLKQEQKNKMDAANGQTAPTGIAGLLSQIIKK